ncbi:cell cycle checkpoint control protein RAD9B [Dipodomys spectabilis]|uniref:cell cycle checkpoint control protein RAD9B n=1 Tax=Dipodomys spectabilis TaxID=105255 RepID=UPI001C53BAE2|nr:cell cycle checkpoint control protein RAD9B [Dipodomys spectabilis]
MLKCTMNGGQLKVFGKTIQALARLSNELWLDPSKQGLVLRSINSSCSAYGYALFSPVFFEQYQWSTSGTMNHDDIPLTLNFKFTMQSLLPIFKCLNFLERNVEKCKMFTKSGKCRFIIQLFCKHSIKKTHNLRFEESRPIQVLLEKNMCTNILVIQPRLLAETVVLFPSNLEEVTLAVTSVDFCLRSSNEQATDMNSSVRSSMCVDRDEFDFFQIGLDTEVTFCLKDLKGFLTLCEAVRGPVAIHFDFPGKPVALSINDMLCEAHFYLATLADDPSRPPSPLSLCLPQEGERSSPARARLTLGQSRSSQAAESISRKISRKRLCPAESPPESGAQENHSSPLKKRAPSEEHPDRESSPVFRRVSTEHLG